ncbi:MAG TPA: hypothetical protein VM733_09420 [Thermoanaerobaculia bacterium]|nr:hypothetical protein [Thermoanaerobaculia bacterium]
MDWNASRFRPEDAAGFYESYFQRANHPSRPLAFWIRYTVFSPRQRPDLARGELWAIYFDGERGEIVAVQEALPIAECHFSPLRLDVRIRDAVLRDGELHGRAASPSHTFEWALRYESAEPPLLLLPAELYSKRFPKAKVLVGAPDARYTGSLVIDGVSVPVQEWRGSQNHNWGTQHTDRYAWGQVAGFDNAPESFLECATAQIRIGPVWSPRLTFLVLRDQGREIALNGLFRALRTAAEVRSFAWTIEARTRDVRVSGRIEAPMSAFVGLRYQNPPGGEKICLNTKLASAQFSIVRKGEPARTLVTRHRAAFEILSDDDARPHASGDRNPRSMM